MTIICSLCCYILVCAKVKEFVMCHSLQPSAVKVKYLTFIINLTVHIDTLSLFSLSHLDGETLGFIGMCVFTVNYIQAKDYM